MTYTIIPGSYRGKLETPAIRSVRYTSTPADYVDTLDRMYHDVPILKCYNDWDDWRREIRRYIDPRIWILMWSDNPSEKLLVCPNQPTIKVINPRATCLSDLTTDEADLYDHEFQLYMVKKGEYERQEEHIQEARRVILGSVSSMKRKLLDQKAPIREWIVALEETTTPSALQRLAIERSNYNKVIASFGPDIDYEEWAHEWHTVVKRCHRHNIPEMHSGRWLRDLADIISPISTHLFDQFTSGADRLDIAAMEWRRRIEDPLEQKEAYRYSQDNGDDTSSAKSLVAYEGNGSERDGDHKVWTFLDVFRKLRELDCLDPITNLCPGCFKRGRTSRECWHVSRSKKPAGVTLNRGGWRRVERALQLDAIL